MRKSNDFFSEINKFFQEDGKETAIYHLSKWFQNLKLSEKTLFGKKSRFNCEFPLLWILSVVKRFEDYETIGGLFGQIKEDALELSIAEKTWKLILELAKAINEVFDISDEAIMDAFINKSEKMVHLSYLLGVRLRA